jgi:hypothetical protein
MSAYHPGFEQHLIDYSVYPCRYRYPDGNRALKPKNWKEIQQRMIQPRPSLSLFRFSDEAFEAFMDKTTDAQSEAAVMTNTFSIIQGDSDIPSEIKRTFGNLTPLTDGSIVNAQPDFYYGARPQQLNPQIRKELNSYIVPSANQSVLIVPNNFTEGEDPGCTAEVVKRQSCYDGALGARVMQHLQSYGQPEPVYDNNAYTIISSYSDGQLRMYTTHPTQPANPGDPPKYHMNQLNAWGLTGNPETFRQGATAFRNLRDWAKEKRDEFIEAANVRVAVEEGREGEEEGEEGEEGEEEGGRGGGKSPLKFYEAI